MARLLRIEYPGAWYHVMARGNRREPIFRDEKDRGMMIHTLGQASEKCGWTIHAWVLMRNHFHFVIHTPNGNLVEGMKWFMNTYTRRLNSRHKLWGRVFGDRYKSVLIEPPEHAGDGDYLRTTISYVHMNPVRARLIEKSENRWAWSDHPWSSLVQGYAVRPEDRALWMEVETGLGLEGFEDTAKGRVAYIRRAGQVADEWAATARPRDASSSSRSSGKKCPRADAHSSGWFQGGDSFKSWLLERVGKALPSTRNRNYRVSDQGSDHALNRAEQIVATGCEVFALQDEAMLQVPGADPRKIAIAAAIWEQTTMGQAWIAERLSMRSAANVSQQIRRHSESLPGRLGRTKWAEWQRLSRILDGPRLST